MWETWVQSLDWEDPLEKGKATHSSNSGLETSMDCIVHGVAKSQTRLSNFHFLAFFMVQLSHPYMTTRKTISLTRQTFIGRVMSLIFNMMSRLVIAFLPRCKCLLISWLQSSSAVILGPPKIKSVTVPLFPHLFAMK